MMGFMGTGFSHVRDGTGYKQIAMETGQWIY